MTKIWGLGVETNDSAIDKFDLIGIGMWNVDTYAAISLPFLSSNSISFEFELKEQIQICLFKKRKIGSWCVVLFVT